MLQNLDLFSDGFDPVIHFLRLRFEIRGGLAELPCVVIKSIAVVLQRLGNRLQFHFHIGFSLPNSCSDRQNRTRPALVIVKAFSIVPKKTARVCTELLTRVTAYVSTRQTGTLAQGARNKRNVKRVSGKMETRDRLE